MVKSIFNGVGAAVPKAPILTEGVVAFTDMTKPGEDTLYPYNPAKAKELLKNAGYQDRDGDKWLEDPKGNPLELSLIAATGRFKGDDKVAQLIQSMLQEVGVKFKLRIMESAAFKSLTHKPPEKATYELGLWSWGIPTADPDEPMMLMFYTKSWRPVGSNRMYYSNEEVDQLALAAHHEVDPEKRKKIVYDWAKLIIADAPILFLPTLVLNLGSRTYLHDDKILPVENYPARFAWIDKEEMKRQGIKR